MPIMAAGMDSSSSSSALPPVGAFSGPLQCIFFAEFDTTVGPTLSCQSPAFLSSTVFDAISPFIITAPELCHKLITLSVSVAGKAYRIVNYPMSINDSKYPRNRLLFSLAFVFYADCGDAHRPYLPVLRKLASYLETLELESEYLFRADSRARLPAMLDEVWRQLSTQGHCTVAANSANRIFLRLYPVLPPPPPLHAWQVPVLLRRLDLQSPPCLWWDLTLRSLIPCIDSVTPIARIAYDSGISLSHVKRGIAQLVYGQAAVCIPPFQFTNAFTPTALLSSLYSSSVMQQDAREYVAPQLSPHELLRVFGSLSADEDVEAVMRRQPGLDVRRLVVFGLVNGLIRRVEAYPVLVERKEADTAATEGEEKERAREAEESKHKVREEQEEEEEEEQDSDGGSGKEDDGEGEAAEEKQQTAAARDSSAADALMRRVLSCCDGNHCSDELCYRFAMSFRQLRRLLSTNPHVVWIHR